MTDAPEEWGPMIQHDGSPCPVVGMFVERHTFSGIVQVGIVPPEALEQCNLWHWERLCIFCVLNRVVQYRIRKPRALLDIIERARDIDDAPEGPVRIKELENV